MVRLGQGCTLTQGKLASLGYGWVQGPISTFLTVVVVDKTTTKGPLQWGFSGWTFHSFTQTAPPGL
jgi:hypothetical protein